jgi:hypothetical protein
MDRIARIQSLGRQRGRVIECLGGNSRLVPGTYFDPAADIDVFDAYRAYIARMSATPDALDSPLLAAARLLTGDLKAADVILDHLPATAYRLDHGAGICWVAPQNTLSAALPWPSHLREIDCWLAGSAEQTALRAWLTEHRDRLRWLESPGFYLPRATRQPVHPVQPPAGTQTRVRHLAGSGQEFRHSNSDLTMIDDVPAIVFEQDANRQNATVTVPLDPRFLHKIDWEDAQFVYERPVEYPQQPLHVRPSIWQRLFG